MPNLTAIEVRNAKPKDKPYKLTDSNGLYLHISSSGKKTWRYRYKIAGTESTFVMGEYPQMTLEQARNERVRAREKVKQGINPAQERKDGKREAIEQAKSAKEKKEHCFEAVALDWIGQQKERWSRNHTTDVRGTLAHDAFPIIGCYPVDTITPPMILQVVRNIEKRGAYEIAHKVLQRITAVLRYAVQTGLATHNPAAEMRGVLKTRKVVHYAALDQEEMPEFLRKLSEADIHTTTKLALKFTILTAARSGEVRGATWKEINLPDAIWRIPAKRMKMDSPHNVPLSKQAMAILERMARNYGQEGFVFPGIKDKGKPLSENTMLYALYRMGYHSRSTVHGFRSVFSTIANEEGFDGDVVEKALAHEERNRVRAAYHRSEYMEERKKLMQWWADLLDAMEARADTLAIEEAGQAGIGKWRMDMAEDDFSGFALDEPAKKAVAEIVGTEHVECVEEAVLIFQQKKRFYRGRPSIPQLTQKLTEARKHIGALKELLGEATTRDYLNRIAKENFPEAGGNRLIAQGNPFANRTPQLHFQEHLEKLDKVCEAAIKTQNPGPGRPKGQKDEAIHDLLARLYQCCEFANGGPLTEKPGNMLERLVKVLNKPLCLGGDLPGLVRKTIEKYAKRGDKPKKEK